MNPIALLAALALATAASGPRLPAYIAAAAADPGRAADRPADGRRHGPELLAFAGVKPGDKVYELIPGSGYFTRLFSRAVGPRGRVYACWPDEYARLAVPNVNDLKALSRQAAWSNITVLSQPAAAFSAPERLDVVFTSQNYHDYPDKFMGRIDPVAFDRQVYRALKPGGVFVIIDHAAAPGAGMRDTDTLHRIDPAIVKRQLAQAGFVFEAETRILRNPADSHKVAVFDPSIRGHTDQFVFRFRKPRR